VVVVENGGENKSGCYLSSGAAWGSRRGGLVFQLAPFAYTGSRNRLARFRCPRGVI
jgi:hypothetical protein